MLKISQKEVAEKLMPLIGGKNLSGVRSFLSQIISGKRVAPEKWISPLQTVMGCNKDGLRLIFPAIRFKGDSYDVRDVGKYKINLIMEDVLPKIISASQVSEVLRAIGLLGKLGIKIEVHICAEIESIE